MQIELSLIKPSPHPLRSSWDEDKMQELTDSIKTQGLVVPIKVRPDNGCYAIVYGHRRAEACRRAGFDSIESLVEGMDDLDALLQGWTENAKREDLSPLDRGRSLRLIQQETGWSQAEMARQHVAAEATIAYLLSYLSEFEQGAVPRSAARITRSDETGIEKTMQIKRAFDKVGIDDPALKRRVHEHAAILPREEVRKVAEAVAHAEDEAEREAILSTDPRDPAFERLVRVRADIRRENQRQEQKKREEDPREVRAFLDAVRSFRAVCREAVAVVDYGKFSPEARRFAIRQLDQLLEDIQALKDTLEV